MTRRTGAARGLPLRTWLVAGSVALVALGIWANAVGLETPGVVAVVDLTELAVAAAAALACGWRGARSTRSPAVAWWLFAAACGTWAAGQGIWTWYEVVALRPAPFPSYADVGFLAFPLFATAGLLALGRRSLRLRAGARAGLGGLLLAASLFSVSWLTALAVVVSAGGHPLAADQAMYDAKRARKAAAGVPAHEPHLPAAVPADRVTGGVPAQRLS